VRKGNVPGKESAASTINDQENEEQKERTVKPGLRREGRKRWWENTYVCRSRERGRQSRKGKKRLRKKGMRGRAGNGQKKKPIL